MTPRESLLAWLSTGSGFAAAAFLACRLPGLSEQSRQFIATAVAVALLIALLRSLAPLLA